MRKWLPGKGTINNAIFMTNYSLMHVRLCISKWATYSGRGASSLRSLCRAMFPIE